MALTSQNILDVESAINAIVAWANGGQSYTATMPNGLLVDSPSKVIADSNLFKAPVAWPPGGTVTDATQTYTSGGVVYAPQPSLLPFTGSGAFPTASMYVVQGILASALADQTQGSSGAGDIGYDGGDLETFLDTVIPTYATVVALKAADLQVGRFARTEAYETVTPGPTEGAGLYKIVAPTSVDGTFDFLLSNGNAAILQKGSIVHFKQGGAVSDGTTVNDAVFTDAASLGKLIDLGDDDLYLVGTGVNLSSGGGFISRGFATLLLKTGSGGFDSVDHTASKDALNRAVMVGTSIEGCIIKNIRFLSDGVTDVVIYPIRFNDGMDTLTTIVKNIIFQDIASCNAGLLSFNSVGDAAYHVSNIRARDCGNAQGNTYWSGTPQITVFEVDNDLVSGVHSKPGFAENIRADNVLLTGTALTDFGQETDVVNIAGISSGSDVKGPTVLGIYANGIGEVLDVFCSNGIFKGIRAVGVQKDVVKLTHGARYNDIEIESVLSYERSVVHFAGGSSASSNVERNNVKIGSVRGGGTVLGTVADTSVVLFSQGSQYPQDNTVTVDNALGDGINLDFIVRDGGANNNNDNFVQVKSASGWANKFSSCPSGNVVVQYDKQKFVKLGLNTSQTLTTTVPVIIQYSVATTDYNSELSAGTYSARPKFPGVKRVYAQAEISGLASGDDVIIEIRLAGTTIARAEYDSSETGNKTYSVSGDVYIDEDTVDSTSADIDVQITVYGSGTLKVENDGVRSYLQVTPVK